MKGRMSIAGQSLQRYLLVLGGCVLCVLPSRAQEFETAASRYIDLTHSFDESTVFWPTAEGFELEVLSAATTDAGFYYAANQFSLAEHGGTHLDAPVHFSEGKQATDEIPLDRLIGPAVIVDVSEKCSRDRDYQVTADDLKAAEKANGLSLDDKIVLIRTGFGRYWPDRERYMGTSERGQQAVPKLHFPGIGPAAASWLAAERNIKAIGIDTPSLDYGQSELFETHVTLFEDNIPGFENVANLDQLPLSGFTVVALPMKIKGGSGGPLRIVAVLPPEADQGLSNR
jgi:kynurenine formamidase